jgi:hypothetical protein
MTTHIVMILDRSGSMSFLEDDVIGGFNSFINEQKKIKDNTKVTTVLFDHEYEILHNKIDLQKIEPITNNITCVAVPPFWMQSDVLSMKLLPTPRKRTMF